MQTEILKITGMTSEASTIDVMNALTKVNGVQTVKVSYAEGNAVVDFDDKRTAKQGLIMALSKAGFNLDQRKEMELAQGSCCGGCGR